MSRLLRAEAPTAVASPPAAFEDLCRIEPRLAELLRDVEAVRARDTGRGSFCANEAWYGWGSDGGFKARLVELVGWRAKKPELRTSEA